MQLSSGMRVPVDPGGFDSKVLDGVNSKVSDFMNKAVNKFHEADLRFDELENMLSDRLNAREAALKAEEELRNKVKERREKGLTLPGEVDLEKRFFLDGKLKKLPFDSPELKLAAEQLVVSLAILSGIAEGRPEGMSTAVETRLRRAVKAMPEHGIAVALHRLDDLIAEGGIGASMRVNPLVNALKSFKGDGPRDGADGYRGADDNAALLRGVYLGDYMGVTPERAQC